MCIDLEYIDAPAKFYSICKLCWELLYSFEKTAQSNRKQAVKIRRSIENIATRFENNIRRAVAAIKSNRWPLEILFEARQRHPNARTLIFSKCCVTSLEPRISPDDYFIFQVWKSFVLFRLSSSFLLFFFRQVIAMVRRLSKWKFFTFFWLFSLPFVFFFLKEKSGYSISVIFSDLSSSLSLFFQKVVLSCL